MKKLNRMFMLMLRVFCMTIFMCPPDSGESANIIEGSRKRAWRNAGAPSDGTSGTYAGIADKGDLLIDTTNGTLYQNTNTKASPTWTQKSSLATYGLVGDMAANGTGTANAVGTSSAPARVDHVHKVGEHDHSDNTKGSPIVEAGITPASLTGLVAKQVADVNVIGGLVVLHRIDVADLSGDNDVTLTHKTRVIDVWGLNTGIAAHATDDTWQVKNGSNAISDAVAKTAAVNAIKRIGSIDPTYAEIAAGGTLRITAVKDTNAAVTVYVLGIRVS
jgi:hypothetical protein